MVNRTCRDIVKDTTEFQVKLFMKQDPSQGDERSGNQSGANGLRWNPFLVHYGRRRNPDPGSHTCGIRIKRKFLQKHDRPEASWKRMFLSYPTRPNFHVFLECRWCFGPLHILSYLSWEKPSEYCMMKGPKPSQPWEGQRMGILTSADKACFGVRPYFKRHTLMVIAGDMWDIF